MSSALNEGRMLLELNTCRVGSTRLQPGLKMFGEGYALQRGLVLGEG